MTQDSSHADDRPVVPDIYVDNMRVTVGVFGVNFTFALSEPHPSVSQKADHRGPEEKVHLRMSAQHAKVMTLLLRQQLKKYEQDTGTTIELPKEVYAGLGLKGEDW